ncbi:hypothetical protein FHG87_002410 [Trinorchestia longiramus]|nr:hypothetical protein FHG87_002410 [Trinorchestia longiramus]
MPCTTLALAQTLNELAILNRSRSFKILQPPFPCHLASVARLSFNFFSIFSPVLDIENLVFSSFTTPKN